MKRTKILKKLTNETILLLKSDLSGEVFNEKLIFDQLNKAMDIGTTKFRYSRVKAAHKKPVKQLDKFGKIIDSYKNMHEAERKTGILAQGISMVCAGKRHTAGGFIWKYEKT